MHCYTRQRRPGVSCMRRIVVVICCCFMAVAPVAARMYQWQNPATGTTQMSGTPPAWYRSGDAGPRVYVFENNQLVDDTGIAVSDTQRDALRAAALGSAAASARTETDESAAQDDSHHAAVPPVSSAPAPTIAADTIAKPATETAGADKAASLKALIEAWDQRQLEQARALLETLPADAKTAPAPP
ncbi:MAG: hypothetical protein IT492_13900 [Gammaproteobacteria bacterium]|nr:hypothetical protein [Gammaproteobacteria bacterium]